jgi:hypothetical protein
VVHGRVSREEWIEFNVGVWRLHLAVSHVGEGLPWVAVSVGGTARSCGRGDRNDMAVSEGVVRMKSAQSQTLQLLHCGALDAGHGVKDFSTRTLTFTPSIFCTVGCIYTFNQAPLSPTTITCS